MIQEEPEKLIVIQDEIEIEEQDQKDEPYIIK